jgi:uncharacterized protein YycO
MNRRHFVRSALIGISGTSFILPVSVQKTNTHGLPRPNPALFESGDFIWPKKPGVYVPYNSGSSNSPEQDKEQWIKERDIYLRKNVNSSSDDGILQKRLNILPDMQYSDFLAIYEGDKKLGETGAHSNGSVYVGHVGILEVDSNKTTWVIEAMLGEGVVRKKYSDWMKKRSDEVFWLGRLKQIDAVRRHKIAVEAKKYLRKPYDFWNNDLNDDSGFYCSKLAWLSIYRALGFPVDDNENPRRHFWFSPKQLLYLPRMERIHDPGPYASL